MAKVRIPDQFGNYTEVELNKKKEEAFNEIVNVRFTKKDLKKIDKIILLLPEEESYRSRSHFIRAGALKLIREMAEVLKDDL